MTRMRWAAGEFEHYAPTWADVYWRYGTKPEGPTR